MDFLIYTALLALGGGVLLALARAWAVLGGFASWRKGAPGAVAVGGGVLLVLAVGLLAMALMLVLGPLSGWYLR